jgi:hypothetical protein
MITNIPIVLNPATKMGHFKKYWKKADQELVLVLVEREVSSFLNYL